MKQRFSVFSVFAFSCVAALTVHCSLTASPGDYSSEYLTPQTAESPSHVIVVAGQRDPLMAAEGPDVSTSDAWTARIRADGSIVGWLPVPSAPLLGNSRGTLFASGNLYVPGLRSSALYADHVGIGWIPLANETLGPAWGVKFAEISPYFAATVLFIPAGVLTIGGFSTESGTATYLDAVWYTPFDQAQNSFAPRADTGLKLVKGRGDPTLISYKNFVYVMGGTANDALKSPSVEFSVLGDKGLSPFQETTVMQEPGAREPYQVEDFTACAVGGTMYVMGGSASVAPLDVVLTSRIDEGTGTLGPWQSATKLPGGRSGAGCFAAHGRLYVVGGKAATARTDTVLSAPILPDGSLGTWETQLSAPLPSARSQIAVTAY